MALDKLKIEFQKRTLDSAYKPMRFGNTKELSTLGKIRLRTM